MSEKEQTFELENLAVTAPKDIGADDTTVVLELDTSGVEGFDEKAKTIEAGNGHLRNMTNTMVHHNATHARAIFDEHEGVGKVESELVYGGAELNVTTHRDYKEGDGATLTFVTQAQCVTDVGKDVLDVLSGLDLDAPEKDD